MTITLNPDPNNQNLFTGLYNPADGQDPHGIAAAYHPDYAGYNLAAYLSSTTDGDSTPGYVVTIDASNWPTVLRPAPVEVFLKRNESWAILNIPPNSQS